MSRKGFLLLDGWVVATEFFLVVTENEQNRKSGVATRVSMSRQRIVTGTDISVEIDPFYRDSVGPRQGPKCVETKHCVRTTERCTCLTRHWACTTDFLQWKKKSIKRDPRDLGRYSISVLSNPISVG